MKSTKVNRFEEGKLVKVDEDTYEIVFRGQPGASKANHKKNKYRGRYRKPKKLAHKWFLTEDDKQVVNQDGVVLSDEVVVVRVTKHNGYRQVFIRFSYDGTVWGGYTINEGPRALIVRATKFMTVNEGIAKGKIVCKDCGRPFIRVGQGILCPRCKEARRKASEVRRIAKLKPCANKSCSNLVSKANKTGFCQKCHRTQGEFAVVRREFNPYYGRMVDVRRKSSNDTELVSHDQASLQQDVNRSQTSQPRTPD